MIDHYDLLPTGTARSSSPAPGPGAYGQSVSYATAGGVARIVMDHPENRNALSSALLGELRHGLATASANDAVRVVLLTHTGPAFCAGADLKGADLGGADPGGRREPNRSMAELAEVLEALMAMPKPVVARIAGHCLGGGMGLAAACDLSIAAEGADFGFTEVRLGVAPAVVSVVCLPRLRRGDALELFLTGERISARRAAEVGLISRVVALDDLDETVATVVGQLCAGAPGALAAAKRLVTAADGDGSRADAFLRARDLSERLFAGDEASAGIAAFLERRPAPWVPA